MLSALGNKVKFPTLLTYPCSFINRAWHALTVLHILMVVDAVGHT